MINPKVFTLLLFISIGIEIILAEEDLDPDIQEDSDIPVVEGFGGTVTIPDEGDILVLNKDNFHHVVGTKNLILVEFYAPWCGHCKALEPEYASAASILKKDNIRIAKVDATIEDELAKNFEVTGYPTLKLFKEGKYFEDFDGARTATGIVEYMKKHADPNYKPPPTAVKVLTSSNFTNFVDSEELSLVEFYAPWCGHCKALAPEYEGAAQDLQIERIPLAKVDATQEKDLTKKYGVTGYPRLFVFRKGRSYDFKGPRQRAGIVSYMKDQKNLPSDFIKSIVQSKNRLSRTEPTIFAYFEAENEMFNQYISSANTMRDNYPFLHTFDKEIAEYYGLRPNSINIIFPEIYHSKYEKKIYRFEKFSGKDEDITKWVSENILPLVGHRTHSNIQIKYQKKPLLVVYYDVNFSHQYVKATQIIREKILPVADAYRHITFAISNEEEFSDDIKNLGLDDSGEDINVAIFDDKNRYVMEPEEEFDSEVLEDFVKMFEKEKLKPYLKSQPIPKRQEGSVKVIVAKNFEKEILQSSKDILIEFYAPWCGHCKQLEPVYKKVAKHFSKQLPNLVVAKMDATANDVHPTFNVEGFPTIFLLKASDKEHPIQCTERKFEEFKNFLHKHLGSGVSKDEL